MKKLMIIGFALLVLVGCGTKKDVPEETPPVTDTGDKKPFEANPEFTMSAVITTELGVIKAELYQDLAPQTVNNFATLANSGFYDGLTFHRIDSGFMIQGGDPAGNGTGGPGYKIKGEFATNGFENTLKHTEGVLSMARAQHKDSAGSQFFIMHGNTPFLDGEYAAFGKVIEGFEIVDQIASAPADGEMPIDKVVITNITVDTNGLDISNFEKLK